MPKQYPTELRRRAVRLVMEQREQYQTEYEAIRSIAAKLGIGTPETLRKWVRQAEIDSGRRAEVSTEESAELRKLRQEVKELRRANGILLAPSSFFAAGRTATITAVCTAQRVFTPTHRPPPTDTQTCANCPELAPAI
jgi:transposase